jgi:hypothetical protein
MAIFLELFTERRFHLQLKFPHFVHNEHYEEATCGSRRLYKLKPILDHLNDRFRSVYTPEYEVSVDESLMTWKGWLSWKVYIPSKRSRFAIKPFELCEAKSAYVWNFIIYIGQDTAFDNSVGNEPHGSIALELITPFSIRATMWPLTIGFQALICIVSYTANRLTPWEHCIKIGSV